MGKNNKIYIILINNREEMDANPKKQKQKPNGMVLLVVPQSLFAGMRIRFDWRSHHQMVGSSLIIQSRGLLISRGRMLMLLAERLFVSMHLPSSRVHLGPLKLFPKTLDHLLWLHSKRHNMSCRDYNATVIRNKYWNIAAIYCMAVYPTASIVATGCKIGTSENNIVFWSVIDGLFEQKSILSKPCGSRVCSIAFSDDGSMMVTGCMDKWLRLFRNTRRVELDYELQYIVNMGGCINMTVFMPKCSDIISVQSNNLSCVEELIIHRYSTSQKTCVLKESFFEDCVIAMRIYENPPILAMVLRNGILELLHTDSDKPFELCARIRFPLSLTACNGIISCADLHPTIPMAAIGTRNGHQVMQFVNCQEDWRGIHVPMRNAPPICVHDRYDIYPNRVLSLAFNEKNNQLAVGGCNGRVDIFQFSPNFSTQSYILRVGGIVKQGINSLMFDPKSNRLLITTYGKPGKMIQW